jgi:hypothetical protein
LPSVEAFCARYWRFVHGDRIFIFSSSPRAVGTAIRFAISLSDGKEVLRGHGTVLRARAGTDDPGRPPGMDVRFEIDDQPSREVVARLEQVRKSQRLPKPAPGPADQAAAAKPSPARPHAAPPPLPPLTPPATVAVPASATAPQSDPAAPPEVPAASSPATGAATPADAAPAEAMQALPDDALEEIRDEDTNQFPLLPPGQSIRSTEKWRSVPTQRAIEAVAPAAVPANPFAQVGDDAIEMFVDWAIDQSSGADATVPTDAETAWASAPPAPPAPPAPSAPAAATRAMGLARLAGVLALGVGLGVLGMLLLRGRPGASTGDTTTAPGAPQRPQAHVEAPPPVPSRDEATPSRAEQAPSRAEATPSRAEQAPVRAEQAPVRAEQPPSRAEAPPSSAPPPPGGPTGRAAPVAARAEQGAGTLSITSRPPGARVRVDGKSVGRSPVDLPLAAGEHAVLVEKAHYEGLKRTVRIVPGATATVDAELTHQ